MNRGVISGDVIAYTSLSNTDKTNFETAVKQLLKDINIRFGTYGRMIKGDYLECYIPDPVNALRVALAIKSYVKSFSLELNDSKDKRINAFKTYGIRLAIGIGEISRFDPQKGIIDGEAIYFSGRIIGESRTTSDKERIVIKSTLFIKTNDENLNNEFEPLLALIDVLVSKATARQCKVLYLKLTGNNEEAIAKKLKLFQSTINEHSTSLGWNAIEKAVLHFEQIMKLKL
ncbi:MAG: fumarate hydratase [Bacteroidota bacterium]